MPRLNLYQRLELAAYDGDWQDIKYALDRVVNESATRAIDTASIARAIAHGRDRAFDQEGIEQSDE